MQERHVRYLKKITGMALLVLAAGVAGGMAAAAVFHGPHGHAVPVHVQKRTVYFPGGVMQIKTVSYSSGVPQAEMPAARLSHRQAAAMLEMEAMQMAVMHQMLQVSSGMPFPGKPALPSAVFLPPDLPARSSGHAVRYQPEQKPVLVHWKRRASGTWAAGGTGPRIPL